MATKTYGTTGWKAKATGRKANKRAIDRAFNIALRVLDLMEVRGWRAADLARAMERTPQYISRILKGQELNLGYDVLDKLADALGAPIVEVATSRPGYACVSETEACVALPVLHTVFSFFGGDYVAVSPPLSLHTQELACDTSKTKKGGSATSPFLMLKPSYAC